MKSGVEQRGKVIFAIVLGVIALLVLWSALRGRPASVGAATPATTTSQPNAPRVVQRKGKISPTGQRTVLERTLDPTLHFDYLLSEKVEYTKPKCNIFAGTCEPIVVQQQHVDKGPHCPDANDPRCGPPPPVCPGPDPRCPPPPIPLQFFGFASRPGEPKRIFLRTTDTNDVFVAGEGEVVNRRYRVLRIMGSGTLFLAVTILLK